MYTRGHSLTPGTGGGSEVVALSRRWARWERQPLHLDVGGSSLS